MWPKNKSNQIPIKLKTKSGKRMADFFPKYKIIGLYSLQLIFFYCLSIITAFLFVNATKIKFKALFFPFRHFNKRSGIKLRVLYRNGKSNRYIIYYKRKK